VTGVTVSKRDVNRAKRLVVGQFDFHRPFKHSMPNRPYTTNW
jgi:hypothetical protein